MQRRYVDPGSWAWTCPKQFACSPLCPWPASGASSAAPLSSGRLYASPPQPCERHKDGHRKEWTQIQKREQYGRRQGSRCTEAQRERRKKNRTTDALDIINLVALHPTHWLAALKCSYFLLLSSWEALWSAFAAFSCFLAADSWFCFSSICNHNRPAPSEENSLHHVDRGHSYLWKVKRGGPPGITLVWRFCMDFSKVLGGALWWLQRMATARLARL